MGIKADAWIRRMALEHKMIDPFIESQIRDGVISYGLSSYGYDIRVADQFKIFTNINTTIVDPKNFNRQSFIDFQGAICIIPPNSFALARTVEYFRIPRSVLTICVGKCLPGSTRIIDPESGELVRLDTFVRESRPMVVAYDGGRFVPARVSAHLCQGRRPVYRIRTRTGRKIEATANHPFLKLEGWTPLSELRVGHRIAVPSELPFFGTSLLADHEAELLGFMIADGQCRTPGSSPRYTSGDPILRERFSAATTQFGGVARPVAGCSVNVTNRGRRGGRMEANRFYAWLQELGLGVRSVDKFVPSRVFRAPRSVVARFLRALFSGDGSVSMGEEWVRIEYASSSERLARDVHHLLLRLGIVGSLRSRRTASGRYGWVYCTTDKESVLRFAEHIGFIPGSRKAERLARAVAQIGEAPKRKSNFNTLPREAWPLLVHAARGAGTSLNALGFPRTNPRQSVPRPVAEIVAAATEDARLEMTAARSILWDVVAEIESAGLETVYDLTVPGYENFVAEDFVVHNSTYARCGIIVNVTPFEPEWEGHATLEISNTTPLPARIYAGEGIAQVIFFEGDQVCERSYADKQGKYQGQQEITLPRV
jgi:deoxycytidine triphosphate deaminase